MSQPTNEKNPWRDALIDELVVCHILSPENEADPRKAVQAAIHWNVQVALDPQISDSAQALVDRGRAEAIRDLGRILNERMDYHDVQSAEADARDMPESVRYHTRMRAEVKLIVDVLPQVAKPVNNMAKKAYWDALMRLTGSWQAGSDTTVKLYQDDATRTCFIQVGEKRYGHDGHGFETAIQMAIEEHEQSGRF